MTNVQDAMHDAVFCIALHGFGNAEHPHAVRIDDACMFCNPRYAAEEGVVKTGNDLRANHPSSSSRRVRAGSGAPGPSSCSVVGNLT